MSKLILTKKILWMGAWLSCMVTTLSGQEILQRGFDLLDRRAYPEAEVFFARVLETDPGNKTARICLGRAVGLGGDASRALQIFNELLKDHPGDEEILFNVAEAALWDDQPERALQVYEDILAADADNVQALLGKANALSGLRRYGEAVAAIERAFQLAPVNDQVKISRKFILLARADEYRKEGEYDEAHRCLDRILDVFPEDESALFDKVSTFLFEEKHRKAYHLARTIHPGNSQRTRHLSLLSYTALLVSRGEEYLILADSAVHAAQLLGDPVLKPGLDKARALTYNHRFSEADRWLDTLAKKFPNEPSIDVTKAQLTLWQGRKKEALQAYEGLNNGQDPSFFKVVGLAEAYNANEKKRRALQTAREALTLQPDNPDVQRMERNLKQSIRPTVNTRYRHSWDQGNNSADQFTLNVQSRLIAGSLSEFTYSRRHTRNTGLNQDLFIDRLDLNHRLFVNGALSVVPRIGFSRLESTEGENQSRFLTGGIGLQVRPGKVHSFNLDYMSSFLDYNPSILRETLRSNELTLTYHMYTRHKIGMYHQWMLASLSDQNKRGLYFGSLYYNLFTYPVVQVAFNVNAFTYQTQRAETYFSPDRFRSLEWMVKVDNEMVKGTRWRYLVTAAVGRQFIEQNEGQWTVRADIQLYYEIDESLQAGINYTYSNSAPSTLAGFTYRHIEISLRAHL